MSRHELTEKDAIEVLMHLSIEHGITALKVYYEGSGDSGAVEGVVYSKLNFTDPDDIESKLDTWGSNQQLSDLDETIYARVIDFAYKILDGNEIDDWYNNDGGWGTICIMVPSGDYTVFNNIRYMNSELYTHGGNLQTKWANNGTSL